MTDVKPETAGAEDDRPDDQRMLGQALENTLTNLNLSIERMEEIVRRFEAGETDLDESISLLSEANELAVASSKELDRAVQKVVYDSDESGGEDAGQGDSAGEKE